MNNAQSGVEAAFLSRLDGIALELVRCFGLKHSQETENLKEPLLRWLDFRLRYIDPKPRRVVLSNRFPKKMSRDVRDGLANLINMIEVGEDINPYQGKGLVSHHDISGSERKNRTDLLWADWGIVHLHLTRKPLQKGHRFSARSEWLLFGIPGDDFFAVVDVRHHLEENVFSDPELMRILVESWPEMMGRFELKGVTGQADADALRAGEYDRLRKSGLSGIITVKGKAYCPPGMGISTASTPARVTFAMDTARRHVRALAALVCSEDGEFQVEVRLRDIREPSFELCVTPRGLAVYEPHLNKAWLLPREELREPNFLFHLQNLIAPAWATKRLFPPGYETEINPGKTE
jgi:hypothetical protein